jgi:hypothetical protein
MSKHQRKGYSSLNNLPESNAAKSATSETVGGSSGVIGTVKDQEKSIPTNTDNTDEQPTHPIDKHGDTWGGGISFQNKEFR